MGKFWKNKKRLREEIERLGSADNMTERNAYFVVLYSLALDAMCKMERDDEPEQHASGHHDSNSTFGCKMAEHWTDGMENADGSHGPHWSMEQTNQVRTQYAPDCDPLKFWVAINSIYSDYYRVAVRHNVNTAEFYAEMAKAFLEDKDAQRDKMARYYEYIVKH